MQLAGNFDGLRNRVGRLQRRYYSLESGEIAKGIQRFAVAHRGVVDSAFVVQKRVFWSNRGIVEPGGNGVRRRNLPILILQHITLGTLQNTRSAATTRVEPRGMLAQLVTKS